jgi:hypothetical protein
MDNDRFCPQPRAVLLILSCICLIICPALIQSAIVAINKGTELAADVVLGSAIIQTMLTLWGIIVLGKELTNEMWTFIPASYVLMPLPLWFFVNLFCMAANTDIIPMYTLIITFAPIVALIIGLIVAYIRAQQPRPEYNPV